MHDPKTAQEVAALSRRPAIDGSDVEKLGEADVPRVAQSLAQAFEDDPVMNWVLRDDSSRLGQLERGFSFYLHRIWLRHEQCYATEELFGAALWLPPGKWQVPPMQQLRLLPGLLGVAGRALPRFLRVFHLIEKHHPEEPEHYYLAVLGVAPELQGRGFGTALMRPVLERCDHDGVPAYLEATSARSRALYERNGFEVVEELRLPDGPPLWPMWREPRR
jgi:ribosomal protein S18 acetylase RimI-like enzyme